MKTILITVVVGPSRTVNGYGDFSSFVDNLTSYRRRCSSGRLRPSRTRPSSTVSRGLARKANDNGVKKFLRLCRVRFRPLKAFDRSAADAFRRRATSITRSARFASSDRLCGYPTILVSFFIGRRLGGRCVFSWTSKTFDGPAEQLINARTPWPRSSSSR